MGSRHPAPSPGGDLTFQLPRRRLALLSSPTPMPPPFPSDEEKLLNLPLGGKFSVYRTEPAPGPPTKEFGVTFDLWLVHVSQVTLQVLLPQGGRYCPSSSRGDSGR